VEDHTVTTQFELNTLVYGDDAGLGEWLIGHFRQHLAYNSHLASQTTPVVLDTFNLMTIEGGYEGLRFWLDAHNSWHELVRPYANVTGVDLSIVDWRKKDEWYEWVDLHNQEHAAIDNAFNLA
jgi:hypothetical protein